MSLGFRRLSMGDLTAELMNFQIFCDITRCRMVKNLSTIFMFQPCILINQCFINILTNALISSKGKDKQPRYRPGVAQRVPGS